MTINELHKKFTEYGLSAKEWQRKCALLLPDIDRKKVWLVKGFHSIYEYAAKLAGLSHGQVMDALRILGNIKDKPALMQIAETRGINAVRPVAAIATMENADFWAEKAKAMPKNELETYVRDFRRSQNSDHHKISTEGHSTPPAQSSITLKQTTLARLQKLSNDDMDTFLNKMMDLYEKSLQEKPTPKRTKSRHIPAKIKKYVLMRSSEKCEFPGCHKKYEHLHHKNRFASQKIHDPSEIFALCSAHHNLVHRGLINENTWTIRKTTDRSSLNNYIDHKYTNFAKIPPMHQSPP